MRTKALKSTNEEAMPQLGLQFYNFMASESTLERVPLNALPPEGFGEAK